MKKVTVLCVGKIKEQYFRDGIAEYVKRLGKYCKIEIVELKDFATPDAVKKESDLILERLTGGYKILMDVNGKQLSSEENATLLEKAYLTSPEVIFVIGGSCGVDDRVRSACDFRLSFGRVTYPHQLMRLILCEQIYRAFCISEGTPYHK